MIYLHTKYHMPSSNGSLVIDVKLRGKENLSTADMLLFYILQMLPERKLHIFRIFITTQQFMIL
jgi:hypothetical protein